jgi:hypothetical protein
MVSAFSSSPVIFLERTACVFPSTDAQFCLECPMMGSNAWSHRLVVGPDYLHVRIELRSHFLRKLLLPLRPCPPKRHNILSIQSETSLYSLSPRGVRLFVCAHALFLLPLVATAFRVHKKNSGINGTNRNLVAHFNVRCIHYLRTL